VGITHCLCVFLFHPADQTEPCRWCLVAMPPTTPGVTFQPRSHRSGPGEVKVPSRALLFVTGPPTTVPIKKPASFPFFFFVFSPFSPALTSNWTAQKTNGKLSLLPGCPLRRRVWAQERPFSTLRTPQDELTRPHLEGGPTKSVERNRRKLSERTIAARERGGFHGPYSWIADPCWPKTQVSPDSGILQMDGTVIPRVRKKRCGGPAKAKSKEAQPSQYQR